MGLGWLDVKEISFNWLLMLENQQAIWLADFCRDEQTLGTALKNNPSVYWYLKNIAPERKEFYNRIYENSVSNLANEDIRKAEVKVLEGINDWLVYVYSPKIYDSLGFLNWDDKELTDIVDFSGKTVLDIGSGTGRLAFVAAHEARVVYAVEPVTSLRRYLREKAKSLGFNDFYAVDGIVEAIPFEDNFADILIAGHVFGDNLENEYTEAERVVKNEGQIVLFPGANADDLTTHSFYMEKGFSWKEFEEPGDGIKRAYWKTVVK